MWSALFHFTPTEKTGQGPFVSFRVSSRARAAWRGWGRRAGPWRRGNEMRVVTCGRLAVSFHVCCVVSFFVGLRRLFWIRFCRVWACCRWTQERGRLSILRTVFMLICGCTLSKELFRTDSSMASQWNESGCLWPTGGFHWRLLCCLVCVTHVYERLLCVVCALHRLQKLSCGLSRLFWIRFCQVWACCRWSRQRRRLSILWTVFMHICGCTLSKKLFQILPWHRFSVDPACARHCWRGWRCVALCKIVC